MFPTAHAQTPAQTETSPPHTFPPAWEAPEAFPMGLAIATRSSPSPGAPSTCCGRGSCTGTTMASTTSRSASTSTSESTFGRHNITDPGSFVTLEAITVASADFLWVCLVNTGYGTPFISALQARPLKDNLYPAANASRSIRTTQMTACGSRGPCSAAPRSPAAPPSTTSGRTSSRCPPPSCRPPRPPSTPPRSTSPGIRTPGTNEYYPILHFSELSNLTGTDTSRQFNVYVNGYRWLKHPETPPYLKSDYVYSSEPVETPHRYNITPEALSNSTLPPILNAVEIYSRMNDANVPSDAGDGTTRLSLFCFAFLR
ncbi:unnamed protein product [Musa hybrid cultivar]